jgi:hypothetical protein
MGGPYISSIACIYLLQLLLSVAIDPIRVDPETVAVSTVAN